MLEERKELYIELIKTSSSLLEVCKKAGIVPTTGNYNTLKKIIRENQIDISHFKRLCGATSVSRKTNDYLHKGSNITSFRLKNRLLKEGYKDHKCEKCGRTEWEGKPIPLELHHINGDNSDNRLCNLQILCPNCHAFTDTYSGKNQKLNILKKLEKEKYEKGLKNRRKSLTNEEKNEIIVQSYVCNSIKEIASITKHSQRTVKKVLDDNNLSVNKQKNKKDEIEKKITLIIESLKKTKSFSGTANEFGVSDNAIKKLLVRRGYPRHIKDLLNKKKKKNI